MTGTTIPIPLHLGPLSAEGCTVQRSGIRWLCDDGHLCRPGEAIAYCNIGLAPRPGFSGKQLPFHDEFHDFQVALAPRLAGRLVKAGGVSRGGFHDLHQWYQVWSPETSIGHLECDPETLATDPAEAGTLKMLLLSGRRAIEHAEVRGGLFTGWHDRSRAWWSENDGRFGTVLSLGICELMGVIRGSHWAFLELFETIPGPAHVAYVPDEVLVPSAGLLCSQLRRTPAEQERIVADLATTLGPAVVTQSKSGPAVLSDWIFAGCLLKALCRSPLQDSYDVLTATGVKTLGPAEAVLLSLNSEWGMHLRHRRLGYLLSCHWFRFQQAGPLVTRWVKEEFEMIQRTPDEVKQDYRDLIDLVASRTKAHLLVLNIMSSSHLDECFCYAPFDKPLRDMLANVRAQELNLMLYELARERDISIVDVDAMAVELGGANHIPDRIHASGRLQEVVRAQVVTILRERGIAGFGSGPGR